MALLIWNSGTSGSVRLCSSTRLLMQSSFQPHSSNNSSNKIELRSGCSSGSFEPQAKAFNYSNDSSSNSQSWIKSSNKWQRQCPTCCFTRNGGNHVVKIDTVGVMRCDILQFSFHSTMMTLQWCPQYFSALIYLDRRAQRYPWQATTTLALPFLPKSCV